MSPYEGIDVPARLRQVRIDNKLTQPELARLINGARPGWSWHQTTVAKIEAGERAVKLDDLLAYGDVFFMMIDELLVDLGTDHDESGRGERALTAQYRERRGMIGDALEQTRVTVRLWEIAHHRERIEELEREIAELEAGTHG